MLGGSWKACSASLAFSAPFSPLLSAECSLLIAHLAQAGSHGLKLSRLNSEHQTKEYRGEHSDNHHLLVRHRYFARQLLAPCIDPHHHDNDRAHQRAPQAI